MTHETGPGDDAAAGVTIDQLVPDEWESLRAVRLRALEESPLAFASSLERELAFDELTWRTRCVTSAQFVARADGGIFGLAAAFEVRPGDAAAFGRPGWHLLSMWVAPEYRRTGLGRALVERVVGYARDQGATSIALWAADDNLGAIRFYESLGFSPTGGRQPMPARPSAGEQEFTRDLAL
jgi:GNAT superfamily N-acetyltransferase